MTKSHPLMVTSNQSYGVDFKALKYSELAKSFQEQESGVTKKNDLSFLYSKESDRIGEGVPLSQSPLSKFNKATLKRKNHRVDSYADEQDVHRNCAQQYEENEFFSYNHNPKQQNPLFTTTANEIGLVKPVELLHTSARFARKQSFSNQFNGIMYRNEGLRF